MLEPARQPRSRRTPPPWPARARGSLVDRRARIHEQRDDVLDLLLAEDALVSEARHVGTRREGFGVVHLAERVLLHFGRVAAGLAEVVERRADGAERELGLGELMARVAVAAGGSTSGVGELHADAGLRDTLAVLPVAQVLAVGGVFDGGELRLLEALGDILGNLPVAVVFAANLLDFILVQAVEFRLALFVER